MKVKKFVYSQVFEIYSQTTRNAVWAGKNKQEIYKVIHLWRKDFSSWTSENLLNIRFSYPKVLQQLFYKQFYL